VIHDCIQTAAHESARIRSLLPHLPVGEAPAILRTVSEAFASIQVGVRGGCTLQWRVSYTDACVLQAYHTQIEAKAREAEGRNQREATLHQQSLEKQGKRWVYPHSATIHILMMQEVGLPAQCNHPCLDLGRRC
jgi:hypothetical protein